MPILTAAGITKSYGVTEILKDVSFHVEPGEKIGVIGVNGAGKTTLMDILSGDAEADSGNVFMSNDTTLGYLKQNDAFNDGNTLLDETKAIYREYERMETELSELSQRIAAHAEKAGSETEEEKQAYDAMLKRYGDLQEKFKDEGGFAYRSEMRGILSGMAFSEDYFDKKIGTLSGGERTRLALACLLMKKPDMLILDEPTNHLDIGMLKWLEQFLRQYKGAVMIVSHDRYFLDHMADRIFEIENRRLTVYKGNYTDYAKKKHDQREAGIRAYNKQQDEIRRQEDMIRRFKERGTEHLAKRAASREKALEHMDVLEKPEAGPGQMSITFHEKFKSGNDVFLAEDLAAAYDDTVFRGVDLDIKRGERIAVVGQNGIGKTTLLKILAGRMGKSAGYLKRGVNLEIGYYDQRQEELDGSKTVIEEIYDSFRLYKESEIRAFLGRFLFKGDAVFAQVGDLSGGEKARLALLKLMMSGANVLLLDEPTNHLDIESKEVFEEALLRYPGTVVAVSHDRYFLNRVAQKIYELGRDGIVKFEGGYDYYEEKKEEITSANRYVKSLKDHAGTQSGDQSRGAESGGGHGGAGPEDDGVPAGIQPGSQEERLYKKKLEAEKRRKARRKQALEDEIEKLEAEIRGIEKKMCEPAVLSDPKKLADLDSELTRAKALLEDDYDEWAEM